MHHQSYQPGYANSYALVLGIDAYQHVGPLSYAANDARGVAGALTAHGFLPGNVQTLLDGAATRAAIMSAFMRFADPAVLEPDDRLLVFFAGHGHTLTGRRGETGFLVPVDGQIADPSTLIRWDELTRNGELIAAKHVLFLMDACYGGLAVSRQSLPPGTTRLLNDMTRRYSRQVLASGKPDEVVADGCGVRPGHSLFTAHLLNGLDGAAATTEGVVTAQGLMAYVYDKVGSDPYSGQTPHYGSIDGDGDFVFQPQLETGGGQEKDPSPLMVQVPAPDRAAPPPSDSEAETLKRLLPDPSDRIRLEEFVNGQLRVAIAKLADEQFSTQGPIGDDEFERRLKVYEEVIRPLQDTVLLLAKWAEPGQVRLLEHIFARLAEAERTNTGVIRWIALSWYPIFNLMYVGGIAALSANRFDTLKACLLTPVTANYRGLTGRNPLVLPATYALVEIVDTFKAIPGYERRYTPRSDYLFNNLQPILEDQLFLGRRYEELFNSFEVMLALTFADVRVPGERVWGPPGRFAWERSGQASYPEIVNDLAADGSSWDALRAGFFGGKLERFHELSEGYGETISKFGWW
jgi:hypothetical protein